MGYEYGRTPVFFPPMVGSDHHAPRHYVLLLYAKQRREIKAVSAHEARGLSCPAGIYVPCTVPGK